MTTTRTSICAALILLTHVPAQATDLPVQGGDGGGAFRAECPSGQYLVGVSIKAGSWVDAIYPLCAPFLADQGRLGQWVRGPRQGGAGGSPLLKDAACPSDRVVFGIKFGWTRTEHSYVDYVELQCMPISRGGPTNDVCVHTGEGCWNKHPNPPSAPLSLGLSIVGDEPFRQNCDPRDEVATGIHGRSGAFVDALGLICGLDPGSRPIKSMKKAPPPAPPPGGQTDGVDLPGSDIRNFMTRNEGICKQACAAESGCRAWTFVKNGSMCWLKNAVPAAVRNGCCISGVMATAAGEKPVKSMKKTKLPADAGNGGAQKTCEVRKPVDICPTADGCGDGTGVEPIGTLEAIGTVTVFSVQGPWHEVKAPGGRQGFVYSAEDYQSLECR